MNLKVGHERGGKPCKGVGEMAIEHTSYYVKGDGDYWGQKGTAVCADKETEERGRIGNNQNKVCMKRLDAC